MPLVLVLASFLLAPLLVFAMIAGAAPPWSVLPALVFVLLLIFTSAASQWWRGGPRPLAWMVVPLASMLLAVWILALSTSAGWVWWPVFLTVVVAVVVGFLDLDRRHVAR
jgi:hypothetical protein